MWLVVRDLVKRKLQKGLRRVSDLHTDSLFLESFYRENANQYARLQMVKELKIKFMTVVTIKNI